jgi:ribosomal protection tetracycline resistance protein
VRTLNLGILAHVDAGKTTLTERLLYTAGVIDEIGSVDAGSTQTDFLALERQRGITIKSAVVSFVVDDITINLIDTPGHPDFIAEVERALGVLDGAVLVISAVEGVQAQTRLLLRTLRRLRIPTLLFVNKIDREGARESELLERICSTLTRSVVPMTSVDGLGTRAAAVRPSAPAGSATQVLDVLTEHDDALLARFVASGSVPGPALHAELVTQTGRALVHPLYFGSAKTGAGIDHLIGGIRQFLPASEADPRAPLGGTVFKIERGRAGERVAFLRLHTGTIRIRDTVQFDDGREEKVTAIGVFEAGAVVSRRSARAGQIAKVWGLGDVRIGDTVGRGGAYADHSFAPPTLETVVVAERLRDRAALHTALTQLAEQDPLINVRQDGTELSVSLYGEVQKEVVQATLADDYGLAVTFRETTTICIERPVGTGAAFEIIATPPNPFLATVGLRVEPGPMDSGITFRLEVELGSMPYAFFVAVEETVRDALRQGLHGWQVTDCVVTMTHSGYWPRQSHMHGKFDKSMSSTAGDFRYLTPLVLIDALRQAGTRVYEPWHWFRIDLPADTFPAVVSAIGRLGGMPSAPTAFGSTYALEGEIPAGQLHALTQVLPGLTRGEGVVDSVFERYRAVHGPVPSRARTDRNPLDRRAYLRSVARRDAP